MLAVSHSSHSRRYSQEIISRFEDTRFDRLPRYWPNFIAALSIFDKAAEARSYCRHTTRAASLALARRRFSPAYFSTASATRRRATVGMETRAAARYFISRARRRVEYTACVGDEHAAMAPTPPGGIWARAICHISPRGRSAWQIRRHFVRFSPAFGHILFLLSPVSLPPLCSGLPTP